MKAEQKRRPQLRGQPVIITESYGSKLVVLDRSPEAAGVVPGMPLQEALSRCKGASVLQADEPYYDAVFDRVIGALGQKSPVVERAELGCAYVGVDGLEAMYGGEARLMASILQAVPQEFNARLGLANGKFPAYIASVMSQGGRATRAPREVKVFLERLTIDLLPISWEGKARLHRFGLHTMGQVRSLSVGSVQAQLGKEGRVAWELAGGVDRRRLVAHRPEETVSESLVFPEPVASLHAVVAAADILLGRAFNNPALRGKYVRMADLQSSVLHRPPWTRRVAFKTPVNDRDRAFPPVRGALETMELPGPFEDMELSLSGITGESGVQGSLFLDVRRQEQLRETMQQLRVRLRARPPIYQVRDVEPWSRIPERRQALVSYDP